MPEVPCQHGPPLPWPNSEVASSEVASTYNDRESVAITVIAINNCATGASLALAMRMLFNQ
jgi:hypothetical protein